MSRSKVSSQVLNFSVVLLLVHSVSTLVILLRVEVTINGTSIPWQEKYNKDRRCSKQLIQKVRNNLCGKLQGVSKVAVKKFYEGTHGSTFCDLHFKLNSSVCGWDIEREINGTVDIGLISPVVYIAINMSLQFETVFRSGARENTTHENLTNRLIEFCSFLYPDTELNKTDLENILDKFTRNKSFEELVNGKHSLEKKEENASNKSTSYPSRTVKAMVGIGAAIICVGIIVFIARVIVLHWRHNAEKNRQDRLEVAETQTVSEPWAARRQPIVTLIVPRNNFQNGYGHPFLIDLEDSP
ncbi:uncharacterized protein LOC141896577 isoform X2 [Acropora palmata]|uniref:uncharacterized protein LOC141896577 isoform X2 n=1 Tax=Acropora palmata TaxID=6131 RepID=UPI003DA11A8E